MDVSGKKVTVVGLGRTAPALVRLLLREGARPYVTECRPAAELEPNCRELSQLGVPYECGGHTSAAFEGAHLVVPSPGVCPDMPLIQSACAAGSAVVGEMDFAFGYCRSRLLAVTGTNGKTTTTELLRALVSACGRTVLLAGNNSMPFSEAVQVSHPPEFIVLEVSSYQLELAVAFRPWIGAVLNVTADHLSRHGSLDAYAATKARLFANQGVDDIAVVNHDDQLVRGMATGAASVWPFSLEGRLEWGLWVDGQTIREQDTIVARLSDIPLPGRHNVQNALAALCVMRAGGFDWDDTLAGLRSFKGVEHRMEHVATVGGIQFCNDSKSTNIASLRVALESFQTPVVLVAGGRGKGADYRVLRELMRHRVRKLVTLGEDAPKLEEAFRDIVAVERAGDMADAVRRAAAAAVPGDVVLLSPACASFDMFENFEHRGRVFKEVVAAHQRGALL